MTAIRNFDLPDGISNKVTGTTSDSYAEALSWTVYGLSGKTIAIKNTHSSNALKYKILTYIYPGGTSFTEVGETSLSAGSSVKHTIGYPCARVIVQVKSSTAGNAATYQIEYTGNRFAGVPSQLDIALSALRDALRGANTKDFSTLEADIEDIRNALSSVGTDKLLTTPDNPSNLDVSLTTQAKLKRWGRDVEPEWVHADEVTAPSAGTALVTKTVGTGKTGYIYGFFISAGEANDFKINWTTGGNAKSIRIPFSGKGSLQYVDFAALNEGMGADAGTDITITNVNAGGSGVVYQARILYAEV